MAILPSSTKHEGADAHVPLGRPGSAQPPWHGPGRVTAAARKALGEPGPRDDEGGSQDKRPRRWPGSRLARDFRCVLPPADDIKLMIMTAGGVSDPYCHPLATPMS